MAICWVLCVLPMKHWTWLVLGMTRHYFLPFRPSLSPPATLISWLLLTHVRQVLPYVLFSPPKIFARSYPPIWLPYLFHLKRLFPSLQTFLTTLFITITPPAILCIAFLLYIFLHRALQQGLPPYVAGQGSKRCNSGSCQAPFRLRPATGMLCSAMFH